MTDSKKKLGSGLDTPTPPTTAKYDLAGKLDAIEAEQAVIKGVLKTVLDGVTTLLVDVKKLESKKKAGIF